MLLIVVILTSVGCSKSEEDVVAKVDDEIITREQLDKRLSIALASSGLNLDDPQMAGFKDFYELQVLQLMIDELLIVKNAKSLGLKVNSGDVTKEINNLKAQFNSEKEFENYFNNQLKMSKKDIEKSVEVQLLTLALFEEITKDITDTEIDIQQYYEDNKDEFYQEEMVRARHILVETEEEAKEIIKQIQEGQDMAQLAKLKSIDPSAQYNEGDLDYFGRGDMVEPFEKAAFALEVGELTETPVQTIYGYHVIRVEDKLEARQKTFEEVKDELRERFIFQEKNEAFYNYVNELRANAQIENKLEEKIKEEMEKAAQDQEKQNSEGEQNEDQQVESDKSKEE